MTSLSIALPCFNEEENVEETIRNVAEWFQSAGIDGEIVAVDDGSIDATYAKLQSLQKEIPFLKLVQHEMNRGYGAAVRSGCDAGTKEYIAFMDSDGQFKAEDFGKLLPYLSSFDVVTGRRRKRADPFMRKVNAKLFGILTWAVLRVWVRDINCAMKIFKKDVWQKAHPTHATGALINAEFFYNLKRLGIPWYQVDVQHYPRLKGAQTGANFAVILRMFRELFELKKSKPAG